MKITWHPHRLAIAIAAVLALAAACSDDDSRSSTVDAAQSSTGPNASTAPESGDTECTVDETAIEDLFDVDVARYPEVAPGVQACGFGINERPGFGFNVTSMGDDVPPYGSYDAAVEQMETEPASSDGTGLVPVDAGDQAVARASAGHAELLARRGDDVLLVTALLPPEHPLAESDDDLLATIAELARLAL